MGQQTSGSMGAFKPAGTHIRLTQTRNAGFTPAAQYEWQTIHGLIGFAAGLVAETHTRRYHDLTLCNPHAPMLKDRLEQPAGDPARPSARFTSLVAIGIPHA